MWFAKEMWSAREEGAAREVGAASENDKVPDVTEKIARARIGLGALAARTGSRNGRAR